MIFTPRRCPSGEGALARFSVSLLRSGLSVTPGGELVQACDLVVGDALEDIGEPGLGIDAVEFGGLNQGIGDCGGYGRAF